MLFKLLLKQVFLCIFPKSEAARFLVIAGKLLPMRFNYIFFSFVLADVCCRGGNSAGRVQFRSSLSVITYCDNCFLEIFGSASRIQFAEFQHGFLSVNI